MLTNPTNTQSQINPPAKNNKKTIIIAVVFFILITAAAISYYVLFSKTPSNNNPVPADNSIKNNDTEIIPEVTKEPEIDKKLDSDEDGIPNYIESIIGTNPQKSDSDGDSYSDLKELQSGYDPMDVEYSNKKLTEEELRTLKVKIKYADGEFYDREFAEPSPSPSPNPSVSPAESPIPDLSLSPSAATSPMPSPIILPSPSANSVPTASPVSSPSPTPSSTPLSFTCGASTVADIDNNFYNTVKIGDQCWLKENLKVTKNPNGEAITRYCYDNDPKICDTDGGLYDWDTTMNKSTAEGAQGICPNGWHVPKDSEWHVLEKGLKDEGQSCDANRSGADCDVAGMKLKKGGSSGFEGILAGYRSTSGTFDNQGIYAYFWSSTESGANAWNRFLNSSYTTVYRYAFDKAFGFSVRCLKD